MTKSGFTGKLYRLYIKMFGSPIISLHTRWRCIKPLLNKTEGLVLDVGSGPGVVALEIAKTMKRDVVALDLDKKKLKMGKGVGKNILSNSAVNFVAGDGRFLPFRTEAFETLLCAEFLEHIKEDFLVIHEIARVLLLEGKLILTVPHLDTRQIGPAHLWDHVRDGYTLDSLDQSLEEADLKIDYSTSTNKFIARIAQKIYFETGIKGRFGGWKTNLILFPFFYFLSNLDSLVPKPGINLVVMASKGKCGIIHQ